MTKTLSLIAFAATLVINAQTPSFQWAKDLAITSGQNDGWAVVTDKFGNVYTTGRFNAITDFDPGPGTYTLDPGSFSSPSFLNAIFVSKLDVNGNFVWAKSIPNIAGFPASICLDKSGNVYTSGQFSGTGDFDPGPSNHTLTSYAKDLYVWKLDNNGNFLWAKNPNGEYFEMADGIVTDLNGNVYTTGYIQSVVDFDPGPGVFNLGAKYKSALFVLKLDSLGNFVWAKLSSSVDYGQYRQSIAIDPSGNIYSTGVMWGLTDVDPGPAVVNIWSWGLSDPFISKLTTNGNFVWANSFGGAKEDYPTSIAIDKQLNVYCTGYFSGTMNYNINQQNNTISSAGGKDIFISKIDPNGNILWIKAMGGPLDDGGNSIRIDSLSNIHLTGTFQGTSDFDPGSGIANLTAEGTNGVDDIFISKLDQHGNFVWAKKIGGPSNDIAWSNAVDVVGNILVTGYFNDTVDFDPNAGVTNLSASPNTHRTFLLKLRDPLSVGISKNSMDGSIHIYPNPTSGITQLEFQNPKTEIKVEIYDSMGKLLQSSKLMRQDTSINLSNLATGFYYLKIFDSESVSLHKIFKE